MKKFLLITLIFLLVAGIAVFINPGQFFTKLIMRISGHYATPKYESVESIRHEAEKHDLYFDRLYRLKSKTSIEELGSKGLLTVPFIQIYNQDKTLLKVASGVECRWNLIDYFTVSDSAQLIATDTMMYDYMMSHLEPIETNTHQDTFDYYVLAGWANFAPKLSFDLFRETNEIKDTLQNRVCISYINMDFQEDWEDVESGQSMSKK